MAVTLSGTSAPGLELLTGVQVGSVADSARKGSLPASLAHFAGLLSGAAAARGLSDTQEQA